MLQAQDIVVALAIRSVDGAAWSPATLAEVTGLSPAAIAASIDRLHCAGLIDEARRQILPEELLTFLLNGLRYVFPHDGAPLHDAATRASQATPQLAEMLTQVEALRRREEESRALARKILQDLIRVPPKTPWKQAPVEGDQLETERAIIAAAAELNASRGFNAMSLRDVAKRAGVNVSLISYYFGSKAGLNAKVLARLPQILFEYLGPLFELGSRATPADYRCCLLGILERMHRDPEFHRLTLWSRCEVDVAFHEVVKDIFEPAAYRFGTAIQACAGGKGDVDALCRTLAFTLLAEQYATVRWVFMKRLSLDEKSADALLATYRNMLLDDFLPLLFGTAELGRERSDPGKTG